ncbi:hypothetical protein SUSAZ_08685 [Sulfolobus acidocaldarius SUSAZ]|nr:hypothetical protein SUSAZ_08685 [Sulfolobus acidocaldarius SUSAZ]
MDTSGYVTVSAKVPRELKELMDKYGIKPGPVIRKALEEEVRRRAIQELEKGLKDLKEKSHISDEEVARLIREDRESR